MNGLRSPTSGRLPSLRAALAVALGLLAGALVVEAAARAFHAARGTAWSAAPARERVARVREALSKRDWAAPNDAVKQDGPAALALHPFVGFDARSAQAAFCELAAATRATSPDEVFHLAIVGGSVSCLLAHEGGERLRELLVASPRLLGRDVRLHVLGQGGMKQPQQAMAVAWAFAAGWRLDAVVNVDGFNEVAIGLQNATFEAHPLYPSFPQWSSLFRQPVETAELERRRVDLYLARADADRACDRAASGPWLSSAALGPLFMRRVEHGLVGFREAQARFTAERATERGRDVALLGPVHVPRPAELIETCVRGWYESSLTLAGLCRERDVRYMHVLQPTLHDEGSKPLTPSEIEHGRAIEAWVIACRAGYPRLREEGAKLVEHGVEFLDASRLFEHDTRPLYYDACHSRRAGLEQIAEVIAARLLERMP